jgi:hypothetical protein
MRGGATEVNETQKWATSKKRLRTTDVNNQNSRCWSTEHPHAVCEVPLHYLKVGLVCI